jgi:hypothetical protein
MKKVKGNNLNFTLLFLIFINAFFIYYCLNKINLVLLLEGFFFINSIFWLVSYKSYHYFLYDDKKLVIKNSWNPFIYKEYAFNRIEQVKLGYIAFLGKSIIIYFDNGRRRAFGATNCSAKKLEEFATVLNEYIQNSQ